MPSGLVALLDDISVIAKLAAASLDDVGAAAAKAGTKAAGVVIDDAAVTPSYVTEFTPDRELPIILRIAKGSLINKLVILLPVALLLSEFLPGAITPLLMLGGLYLCFEGAEKVIEKLGGAKHGETLEDPIEDIAAFERQRISGAIRTDFILSAEIMAIALAEVADSPLVQRAIILALVGVVITVAVYGVVALIVKMDDIGLHLTKRPSKAAQRLGRLLLAAMPKLLALLSSVGTLAMLWVGGGIILHGSEELGLHGPAGVAHAAQHAVAEATGALGGILGWLSYAVISAIVGLILGAVVAVGMHLVQKARALKSLGASRG
jgi:predicted DNA repair protein MutK